MATLGMTAADKEAVEAFRRDVVEPSMDALVILDFWAEWCGPCKQLGPIIEKVARDYAGRGVKLVKIDVDKDKLIAAQFRVRSVPTVYAIFQGQPVADLTPARTEGQLTQMLDQLLRQLPINGADEAIEDIAPLIEMGEEVLAAGDAERAVSIFTQITEMAPEDSAAVAGLARALLAIGDAASAQVVLDALPEAKAKDAAIVRARAAVALAQEAGPVGDLDKLRAALSTDADDQDARFELAGALMGAGARDEAAEILLGSIERDREWNESAARKRLLTLFEATGLEDPWVGAQRRKLSAVLFG